MEHRLPFAAAALAAALALVPALHAAEPTPAPAPAPAPAAPPPPAEAGRNRADLDRQLAEARRRLEESSREVARLSAQLGEDMGDRLGMRFEAPPRALLGVQVGTQGDEARGARVIAVSPGGAAEQAGIRAGDVITHIGGTELRRLDESPSRALVTRARQLEPEKPVALKLLREGKPLEVQVTPHAAPAPGMGFPFAGPPGDIRVPVPMVRPFGVPGPGVPGGEGRGEGPGGWARGVPLAGMELATLSERLGRYFGAKEGVLVVRAGAEDAWKLQDGDVILSIDGREPTSASHATRILRSYQRGEKLQMKVLRDRRTLTLDITLPGG